MKKVFGNFLWRSKKNLIWDCYFKAKKVKALSFYLEYQDGVWPNIWRSEGVPNDNFFFPDLLKQIIVRSCFNFTADVFKFIHNIENLSWDKVKNFISVMRFSMYAKVPHKCITDHLFWRFWNILKSCCMSIWFYKVADYSVRIS